MNSIVEKILLENVDNPASLFVFPTDVAASRWADLVLHLRRGGTVALDKFIAWDTFKKNSINSKVKDKKSIPSVLRKMFINALIQENAELCAGGKAPVFTSLIRTEWAGQAGSFANWLTGILPQLGIWFRQASGISILKIAGNFSLSLAEKLSGDDLDLLNLAMRYSQFLEKHGLFEPAWETPPFNNTGKECFIFFPDSLSDFSEYRELLEASLSVKLINTVLGSEGELPGDVFFYANSRSEIAEAALYIKALHDNNNIPWNSISVSLPDCEFYGPYLYRELENRNIPFIKQSGSPLASHPAGKFFASLSGCASADFSFASITELLLNQHLPWKHNREIQNLIHFGIDNNCISSWVEEEDGKENRINAWEDAFTRPFGGIAPETRKFFSDIKRQILAVCNASSFSEIRKQYFVFRGHFFEMDKCLEETDTILSRCISELIYLAEIEKDYPEISMSDRYAFFTSYLEETNYLAQQKSSGVAILPYRTAAPAPFDCHIVLGAEHKALTAVFSPLPFLSKNRREKLGLSDMDASKTFIALHQLNSRLPSAFFCSEHTFSGYAIPHNALAAPVKPRQRYGSDPLYKEKFAPDLYSAETAFYACLQLPAQAGEPFRPAKIHKNQKLGFENWFLRRKNATPATGIPALQKIRSRYFGKGEYSGMPAVSASSMAPYFKCPYIWIFKNVLELENVEIETTLMASNIAGDVFHAVLNLFLNEIKQSGMPIAGPLNGSDSSSSRPMLTKSYSVLLGKSVKTVFDSFPCLPGSTYQVMSMLNARLLCSEEELFYANLEKFLVKFISFFAGFKVIATEAMYQLKQKTHSLKGKVDCVLEDSRDSSTEKGSLVIVDFKTKYMPGLNDYFGEEGLKDFQLPMYISLAEAEYKKEVHSSLFFSIIDTEPMVLFGSVKDEKSGVSYPKKADNFILHGSDEYKRIMGEFNDKAAIFADEISNGKFPPYPEYSVSCPECAHNKICRTLYRIYQGNFSEISKG